MFRTSMLAVAALAALGLTALSTTDAHAWGGKGWGKGGWGGHWGHHHRHWGHFPRYGFYGVAAPDCYRVVTRRGLIRYVCD